MARITIPTRDDAPVAAQAHLDAIAAKLGRVPNFFRVLATSPAVLAGYSGLADGLARTLDLRTRERIALAVAEVNGCDYCLAAHGYTSLNFAHLSPDEIAQARQGTAGDAKAAAAARFARQIALERGKVGDADIAAVREAGFSDAQIVEIVAVVAENFLTNLVNNVIGTDIDFPAMSDAQAA